MATAAAEVATHDAGAPEVALGETEARLASLERAVDRLLSSLVDCDGDDGDDDGDLAERLREKDSDGDGGGDGSGDGDNLAERLRDLGKDGVVAALSAAATTAEELLALAERQGGPAGAMVTHAALSCLVGILDCIAFADCAFARRGLVRYHRFGDCARRELVRYRSHRFGDTPSALVQLRLLQLGLLDRPRLEAPALGLCGGLLDAGEALGLTRRAVAAFAGAV